MKTITITAATILAALATLAVASEPGFARTRDVGHAMHKISVRANAYASAVSPVRFVAPNATSPAQPYDRQLEGRF